jgi:hypothetical protein
MENNGAAPIAAEMESTMNLDAILVMLIGTAASANDTRINELVDGAADKLIALVKDSETKVDDVTAKIIADKAERFAARIKAGV